MLLFINSELFQFATKYDLWILVNRKLGSTVEKKTQILTNRVINIFLLQR